MPASPSDRPNGSDTNSTSDAMSSLSTVSGHAERVQTPATEHSDADEAESSDVSTSSEEPSSDSGEDDEDVDGNSNANEDDHVRNGETPTSRDNGRITIRTTTKPAIKFSKTEREQGMDLKARLKDFLPKMAAANLELEDARAAGTLDERNIENVNEAENEEYIEMNLGLGVLEERKPGATDMDCDSEDNGRTRKTGDERDVMGALLGQERDGAGIQVIENSTKP